MIPLLNQLLYLFIIYFLFFIVVKVGKLNDNNNLIAISGVIFFMLAYAIFNLLDGTSLAVCDSSCESTGASNNETFFFEVSPEKLCDGGEYLRSSSPEKQKICSQFTKDQLANFQCSPAGEFNGRPVLRKGYNNNY